MIRILDLLTQYTGTGARIYFEYGFELFDEQTVQVLVNGIPVSFVRQDLGVVIEPAPALNATILIYRLTDVTQLEDYQPFESFDAAKTEWSCDKLIMLKQEALIYRAQLNLYAQPYLDRVEVVNDKGTDAILYLWNFEKAGMFAGEVTTQMPNAGTFVEKPWDFAYFQYGDEVVPLAMILTTTPYPIEVVEGMTLAVGLSAGAMRAIPNESVDLSYSITQAPLVSILLTTGPYDEAIDLAYSMVQAPLVAILLETGPYDEAVDLSYSLVQAPLETKLVTADTPDEGLLLAVGLRTGECSMDPV